MKEGHSGIIKEVKERESKKLENVPYMTTHFDFFFSFLTGAGVPGSILRVCRNERTRFMKRRSTFWAVFAEVSMNSHPN